MPQERIPVRAARNSRAAVACLIVAISIAISVAISVALPVAAGERKRGGPTVEMSLDVAPVWPGHPVGFCLLTDRNRQYVAYYDARRRMTVAMRALESKQWRYKVLPSNVGWDSHNSITMVLDEAGHVHLSGNMHCVPLIYFRTTRPRDIGTFEQVRSMVGPNERRCTYPRFMRGADGELIFHYRDGGSGRGNEIYNVYDLRSKTWRRLLDTPLTDGRGRMNAYAHGPVRGPDGRFHLCWMWRDTPDCRTNHHISYARSPDLVCWETAGGKPVKLPITIETEGVIVDPVPSGKGLINMGFGVGFDAAKRPIVTYHNYDATGNSQVYNARWEGGRWKIHQTSDWKYRWSFGGGGSVSCHVRGGTVSPLPDGSLSQSYRHKESGSGIWKLDSRTLKPVGRIARRPSRPPELNKVESDFPGMQMRWGGDIGDSGEPNVRYFIRWETLGRNRDRPRKGPLPPPSMLRLYKIAAVD